MDFLHSFSKLIFFVSMCSLSSAYYYIVMKAETTTSSKDFCVYSEKPPALSKEVDKVKPGFLETDSAVNWCANDSKIDSSDKVLLLPSGKCSLSSQIQNFHSTGGRVVLFVNNLSVNYMNFMESDYLNGTGIPAMKISRSSAKKLKEMGKTITVRLFKPRQIQYVYFYIILLPVAVMIVFVSSITSGHATYHYFTEKVTKKGIYACEEPPAKEIHIEDVQHLKVGMKIQHRFRCFVRKLGISIEFGVFIIFLTSCYLVFLVTAFAVTKVMGYSLNGYYEMYCSVTVMLATVLCLSLCLDSWTINYRYSFSIGKSTLTIPVLSLILNSMAFGLTAAWANFQDTKLLQNLIFILFCCGYLRLLRLRSLKVVTIVLLFFVTIDTYVAYTAGHSNENGNPIRYVGKLDNLNNTEDVPTGRKYGILMIRFVLSDFGLFDVGACFPVGVFMGIEDIITPGFLLSYCCAFDLCSTSKRIYFLTSVIFYGIGMILTMLVKEFWNPEEPTLIFTVPTIFIPLLGWCRGELNALWNGLRVLERAYRKEIRRANEQNFEIILTKPQKRLKLFTN